MIRMSKSLSTKEKLLAAATELFWTRGYSNVSVRQIAGAAGVDAALVSRYFGSKQGLFEATLQTIPAWDALRRQDVLAATVATFSEPFDPETDHVNPFTMLLANVIDPVMGAKIRSLVQDQVAAPLAHKIGGADANERAASLLAVLFGFALMRKNFQLEGLTEKSTEELRALLTRLAQDAVNPGHAPSSTA